MYVKWNSLLTALGCQVSRSQEHLQPCPLHPEGPPTLKVTEGHISTIFACNSPNCRFKHGNAVQLTAAYTGSTVDAAAALFAADPRGRLYHTRIDTSDSQQGEYSNGIGSQAIIRTYLGRCHAALAAVQGCLIQSRWAELGYNMVGDYRPLYFGALVPDDLPEAFRAMNASVHKHAYATHAYEYDGKITAVSVRAVADPDKRVMVNLHHEPIGVYPEFTTEQADRVFLATNEMAATALRTMASMYRADLPVYATLGLPLPPQMHNVKTLYIITYPGNELTLAVALNYLAEPQLIESGGRPAVQILEYARPPDLDTVRRLFERRPASGPVVTLPLWIARQLKDLYLAQGLDSAIRTLQQGPDLASCQDALLAALAAENADHRLCAAVQEQCASPRARVMLANGNIVDKTPQGYRGIRSLSFGAKPIPLSNATLEVLEELLDLRGTIWYRCLMYVDKQPEPISISLRHMDFENGGRLQRAVTKALSEQRIPNHAVFYTTPGFAWSEIRDSFKKNVRMVKEITAYGADDMLDIHLPGLVITDKGTAIEPQRRVISIPDEISRYYGGIDYRTQSNGDLSAIIDLWGGQSYAEAGIALGISHVLYCVVQDMLCKKAGILPPLQHLCYIAPALETWRPVCEQLSVLFSGVPLIARLPSGPGLTNAMFYKQLAKLGSLPWLAELPNSSLKRLRTFVNDTPVNIIGIGGEEQGAAISGMSGVVFASSVAPLSIERLASRRISALRTALPTLLQAVIGASWNKSLDELATGDMPAAAMYHGVANLFEQLGALPKRAPVNELAHTKYAIPNSKLSVQHFRVRLSGAETA